DGHDRVGQIRRVVLIAAATQQEHVDPLAVLELVRDRAGRRIDRLDHLADRVDVVPGGGGDEVVESLVGQRRPDDQDDEQRGDDRRWHRPGQAIGDAIAGPPGLPGPGPRHEHRDFNNAEPQTAVTGAGRWWAKGWP